MTRVAPGTLSRIRQNRGGFILQVQGGDAAAAATALRQASEDLWALGPSYVSAVVPAPGGPFVYIDASGVGGRGVALMPELVAGRLVEAGVDDADVVAPPFGGPLDVLAETPREVSLHLGMSLGHSPPARALPSEWLGLADEWLRKAGTSDEAWVSIRSVQFQMPVSEVAMVLDALASAQERCLAISGDLSDRIAGFHAVHKVHPLLVLGYGGPRSSDAELVAMAERFKDFARELAPMLGYAFIAVEPILFSLARARVRHDTSSGFAIPDTVWRLSDRLVIDAFCWQILGPGHAARLNEVPAGATLLADGRFELALGETERWLPGRPEREDLRSAGRRLLAPCLAEKAEATRMLTSQR